MEQNETTQQVLKEAKDLMERGKELAFIESHLKQKGMEETALSEILKELKRLRNAKRTKNGSLLILIGVLMLGTGFLSCIAIHFSGGSINFALFGVTAIGAVVLIAGLILLFS